MIFAGMQKEEIVINKLIDGRTLARMMISGANNLYNNRQHVNDLNVFPVPDGDTGTNMSMTAAAMAKALKELVTSSATKAADTMSFATLRGARGNSGVILSQFFRGIAKEIKGKEQITAKELAAALKSGSDSAYKAVMNPTEGTILTVARELAASAVKEAENEEDAEKVIEKAVSRGNKVLEKTREMLPALKNAGVVDAGGRGWMYFVEGVLFFLKNGSEVEKEDGAEEAKAPEAQRSVESGDIKFMYCTEFIIEKANRAADIDAFRHALEPKGDCMLVIDDDDIVKVHIHTNNPGFVLEKAVKIGSLVNIKIDNMKNQHQSLIKFEESFPKKETAFIGVCSGSGLAEILKDAGIDYVIEGGQTMNPSAEDISEAVGKANADTVFVFPNNKNIILAAEQAKELAESNVIVIPTRSIPQCISAMLAYNGGKSPEDNEKRMLAAAECVKTGQVTFAVRDTEIDGVEIKEGDIIGMTGGKISEVGKNAEDVLKAVISSMTDDDSEFLNVYCGADADKEAAKALEEELEELYPDLEVSVKYGGQPIYYYIASAE